MNATQPMRESSSYIEPFEIKTALTGLELANTDEVILGYLNFLKDLIPIHNMYFLHYLQPLQLFKSFYDQGYLELLQQDAMTAATREQMQVNVNRIFTHNKVLGDFIVDAQMGNPLTELITKAKELEADLTVVGQTTEHNRHSILAKRFVRRAHCNALLIPDQTKPKLTRILVPVDYSALSIKAIKTAVAITKQLEKPVPITCLSIYEIPPINWYKVQRTEQQMKKMIEQDRQTAFEALKAEHFPGNQGNIHLELIEKIRPGIGKYIMNFAQDNQYDLIIMGAKGHSTFERLMLGSVTEQVVTLTKSIPVLVIR